MNRIEAAKGLLKRIEGVDLHSNSLDEIDARWWCIKNNEKFEKVIRRHNGSALGCCLCIYFYHPDPGHGNGFMTVREYYSRSRDALKAARPEGWLIKSVCQWGSGCVYEIETGYEQARGLKKKSVYSPMLPTEELAEFHAIVQAWIYVWENEG